MREKNDQNTNIPRDMQRGRSQYKEEEEAEKMTKMTNRKIKTEWKFVRSLEFRRPKKHEALSLVWVSNEQSSLH